MVEVTLKGLSKKFGDSLAVNHVDLDIQDKSFVTLLGPSGCGKTTTLRMIAGLETPTEGEIYFDGKSVTDIPPHQRNVAMVFQDFALYPHMNAYDNIAFNLRMKKRPENEVRTLVEETSSLLKIGNLLDRAPAKLSGGERQRVALARALVRQPAVFLLDEPLSNIDAKLREEMRSELIKIHERVRTTFVYVTHDQVEAMTLSSRVAVMNQGRIEQYDAPMNLYQNPVNTFVASFVGSPTINLFRGKVTRHPGEERFSFEGEDFTFAIPAAWKLSEDVIGTDVTLGVRPIDVSVGEPESAEGISATIYTRELRGSEIILSVRFKEVLAKIETQPECPFRAGDPIVLAFRRGYFFDGKGRLLTASQS